MPAVARVFTLPLTPRPNASPLLQEGPVRAKSDLFLDGLRLSCHRGPSAAMSYIGRATALDDGGLRRISSAAPPIANPADQRHEQNDYEQKQYLRLGVFPSRSCSSYCSRGSRSEPPNGGLLAGIKVRAKRLKQDVLSEDAME